MAFSKLASVTRCRPAAAGLLALFCTVMLLGANVASQPEAVKPAPGVGSRPQKITGGVVVPVAPTVPGGASMAIKMPPAVTLHQKTATTPLLTMTGFGNVAKVNAAFSPKTVSTAALVMTGQGAGAPGPAKPFVPKSATTGQMTMTGQGK